MTNEEMFEANMKLAYKIANKYLTNYQCIIEDIYQVALLGLWKAVLTFKHTHAFSTYAYRVISNEINHYLRRLKTTRYNISLEVEIGENITIADTLTEEENCIERVEEAEEIRILKSELPYVLKKLNNTERTVCLMMLRGKKQREIAKDIESSQVQVSRIEKRIKKELATLAEKVN